MREPRIYVDLRLECGQQISLPVSAAHHVGGVLRRRTGQRLWLFNGRGGSYLSEIRSMGKRQVDVLPLEFHEDNAESSLRITLAQGVSRGQHMDYTVQKAVELGVARIVPIVTEFANIQIEDSRREKKLRHWQKIVISACEQCGRNLIPDLSPPVSLGQFLEEDNSNIKLILHPQARQGISSLTTPPDSMGLLCGPEGGFSADEADQALSGGFVPVSMGPRVLRTETAALAAISICQSMWGDMGTEK